jgi:hypothetical protein
MIADWTLHVAERQPVCLSCDFIFSPASLPAVWLALSALQSADTISPAMMSGICDKCGAKSDRELMDAALNDLRATFPDVRRIELADKAGRA